MTLARQLALLLSVTLFFTSVSQSSAETISLKECVRRTLVQNPLLDEARINITAATEGIVSAEGRHYPRITLDSNITQRQDPLPYIPAQSVKIGPHFSDNFASYTLLVTIPLYQGGQTLNGVKLSKVREAIQQDAFIMTRNELIANTVNTYYKIQQLQNLKASALRSVEALNEQIKNARLMFDVGRIAKLDLLKVEVQKANEEQRLLAYQEALNNACNALRYFMGETLQPTSEPLTLNVPLQERSFETNFDEGLKIALSKSKYQYYQRAVEEAALNSKTVIGKMLPSINAFGGYLDQFGFTPWYKEANWFVGLNLNMPLFDKSLYADISRERILREKNARKLKAVENQIRFEMRNAMSSITESRNRIRAAEHVQDQARESFRIEKEKYAVGSGAMAELLLSQAAEATAEANYTQALYDYNAAIVDWQKATSTLEEYL